jgi:hypothetical protein
MVYVLQTDSAWMKTEEKIESLRLKSLLNKASAFSEGVYDREQFTIEIPFGMPKNGNAAPDHFQHPKNTSTQIRPIRITERITAPAQISKQRLVFREGYDKNEGYFVVANKVFGKGAQITDEEKENGSCSERRHAEMGGGMEGKVRVKTRRRSCSQSGWCWTCSASGSSSSMGTQGKKERIKEEICKDRSWMGDFTVLHTDSLKEVSHSEGIKCCCNGLMVFEKNIILKNARKVDHDR